MKKILFSLLAILFVLNGCYNREKILDRSKLSRYDFCLYQQTPVWELAKAVSVEKYGIAGPENSCIDVAQAAFSNLVKSRGLDNKGKVPGSGDLVPKNWFGKLPTRVSKVNKNATGTTVNKNLIFSPYKK